MKAPANAEVSFEGFAGGKDQACLRAQLAFPRAAAVPAVRGPHRKVVMISPQPKNAAPPRREGEGPLIEKGDAGLVDGVVPEAFLALAGHRSVEAHVVDGVVTRLDAEPLGEGLVFAPAEGALASGNAPIIKLFELIAARRIVEAVGEV